MTCTLDDDVHAWIKNKRGKNSTFVNNVLLKAMQKELEHRASPQRMPKVCGECHSMRFIGNKCAHCGVEA